MELSGAVRRQAHACADLGSPMYAELLNRVADDIEAGGVCAAVLAGHEDDPGPSALALRLLGSVHRLVLDGRAPGLAELYPSTGGQWRLEPGWHAFRRTLRERSDVVRAGLDRAPQTNEVGRAAALMGGLLHVVADHAQPVRLGEIGASAGLNLRADRFCYVDDRGREYGRRDSPVRLDQAWRGRTLPTDEVVVVDRLGCDLAPADVSTEQGRRTLMSYVWPDQVDRWSRLQAAFRVAADVPAQVRQQDARAFVDDLTLADGTTTVLWHSVMWQYLDPAEQEAVGTRLRQLGEQATASRAFAHLCLEPTRRSPDAEHEFLVVLQTWPGGERRVLGRSAPHGLPTVWE